MRSFLLSLSFLVSTWLIGSQACLAQCSFPAPSPSTITLCAPGQATVSVLTMYSNTNLVHRWYSAASGGTSITGPIQSNPPSYPVSSSYTANFTGTTSYYVSTYNTSTGCESARSEIKVTVENIPITANSVSLCSPGVALLSVSGAPAGSSITWKNASGTQVGTGEKYTTPSLSSSTYFTVTVFTGSCSVSKQTNVTVNSYSYPLTVPITKTCTGQSATLVAGGGPSGSYYSWYDANYTLLQFSASNTYVTSALSASARYYVNFSIAAPPYCTSDFIMVDVQVGPPTAPTTTGRAGCPGTQLSLSAAGLPAGASYRWYNGAGALLQESTSATFVTPALSATTAYSVAIFKGCESARTPVIATITSIPTPVTTSVNSCGPGTITLQAMSQLSSADYSHRWYTTQTGGSPITGVVSNNPQVYPFVTTYTADFQATTSYYVSTYHSLSGCESARTQVTATIQPNTAFSAPSYRLCSAGKAYLYVSGAPTGSSITWKDAAGTQVGTGSTYTTNHLTTSTFYKVTVTVPSVCSTTKQVDVTVSNTYGSPVVTSNQVCRGQRATLTVSGAPAGAYLHWYDNATTYVPRVVSPTTTFLTDELTTNRIYYVAYITVNNPSCTSDRIAVTALVMPNPPGLPTTTATTYAFADTDDYIVTATPGAHGNVCRWYETATGGFPFEGNTYNPSSECLLSKNVYVSTYNSSTGCEGDRKMLTLTVGPNFCKNLIRNWIVQQNGVTDETTIETLPVPNVIQATKYFDGLGRFVQEVTKQKSPEPLKNDIITAIEYDEAGRESKKFLPFTFGSDGFYKRNYSSDQAAFYATAGDNVVDDTAPYSDILYEKSPLNRAIKQGAPGTIWQPNSSTYAAPTDRSIKVNFEAGLANEVLLWTYILPSVTYPLGLVNASIGATPVYYLATQLSKNKTKDEHQNEIIEYKDKEGKTLLKKIQLSSSDWAETYYIYDGLGSLVTVIPPEAVQLIQKIPSAYFNQTDAAKETFLKKWAYRYKYDSRGRLIEKQIPGADFIAMVYDNRDRLVCTQDGNQYKKSEWSYTKFDMLNRPVITGIYRPGVLSRTALQTKVDDLKDNQDTKVGYQNADVAAATDGAFPSLTTEVLSITYYDNYAACTFCNPTNPSNPQRFQAETWVTTGAEAFELNLKTRGLVVGTSVKVLGEETWLKTVNYYDYQNRVIQTVSVNYLGGYDRMSILYDFGGKTLEKLQTPSSYTAGYTNIRERFKYDHVGRLMKQYHQIGSQAEVLMVNNAYNQLGQLIDKKLHSDETGTTFSQSIDYQYNVRGWLTQINNSSLSDREGDQFGMDLLYNKTITVNNISYPAQYNGNIVGVQWISNDGGGFNKKNIYAYRYDALNRLQEGRYATLNGTVWTGDVGLYDEVITGYDKNGNIKGLERYGKVNGARTGIDMLTYVPNGNQITRVDETGLADKSFKNLVNQAGEYIYDANGNMNKDLNKGIDKITYNLFNLPQQVDANAAANVKYTYAAIGVKLRKTLTDGNKVSNNDYLGMSEYKDLVLSQILTSEGRAVPSITTPGAFDYEYHLKDHLGNVRLAISTATKPAMNFEAKMETKSVDVAEGYTYNDNVRQLGDGYNSSYSARLNGSQGTVIGPSIALKVSPGDKVSMEVFAKYIGSAPNNSALLTSVKSSASATAQALTEGSATAITGGINLLPAIVFTTATTVPRAYLNYIFFDEDFNFTVGESGYDIIKGSTPNLYEKLMQQVDIKKEGYLYIYVANESSANVNVFFDNFKVSLTEGAVVAKTDYYPFGGVIGGLSHASASITRNKYLYNGKEMQDDTFGGINLEMYDYGARIYDAQLGRWHSRDPLGDKGPGYSPYAYSFNNPILFIDPDGMWPIYGPSGNYLGDDGRSEAGKDLAFVGTAVRDAKGNITGYKDLTQFTDNHTAFQIAANLIKKESSGDKTESLWIAHTANNAQKDKAVNYTGNNDNVFDQLMDPQYSTTGSGARVSIGINDNSEGANNARAGLIDVLTGGADPTGRSVLWDGFDFLRKGYDHLKFKEYNHIRINSDHLKIVTDFYSLQSNKNKINKHGTVQCMFVEYTVPSVYLPNVSYWQSSGNPNRQYGLSSTNAHGGSIFWTIYK